MKVILLVALCGGSIMLEIEQNWLLRINDSILIGSFEVFLGQVLVTWSKFVFVTNLERVTE